MMDFKMIAPLGLVLFIKNYVDATDPFVLQCGRVFFVVGQVVLLAMWALVRYRINGNAELQSKTISVTKKDLTPPNPLADALGAGKKDDADADPPEASHATAG